MDNPPNARTRPKKLLRHGHVRVDPYYWLNRRDDPEVLRYLEEENDYTENAMSHTKALQETLFREIASRLQPDDLSVPYLRDGYFYYHRFEAGAEYAVHCRKKGSLDAPEEVLVDANALASGHDYFSLFLSGVSPDANNLAYAIDTKGRHLYTVYFKNLSSGELFPEVLPAVTGDLAWANDNRTIFYTKQHPETLRAHRLFRHLLGTDPSEDELVYEERDETYELQVFGTKSRRFIMLACEHSVSSEYRYLDADTPDGELRLLEARLHGHEYSVSHHGEHFYILTNQQAVSFKLVRAPIVTPSARHWEDVVPHRMDVLVEDFEVFRDFLVLIERCEGRQRIRVIPWEGAGEHEVSFEEPAYHLHLRDNFELATDRLRFGYTSLRTPRTFYDYDMRTRQPVLLKREPVVGDFDPDDYVTERLAAAAPDGAKVPISLVYHKDTELSGKPPLVLYGYGSYGINVDASFSSARLSLLDRGFVYAIAHVRGSQMLGRHWYDSGRLLRKRNTFTDYIAAAEHLVSESYVHPERLFGWGGSAGGLLLGAVINMKPELFRGVVAHVPFVDVVTTMLDDSIPLTTSEYDEWGDPRQKQFYDYMLSFSPYDNVERKDYPHLLVTAGYHDPQVPYWEPAKWVAKLRATKTDSNRLLLKTNMEAGHHGESGRFQQFRETALCYAFLIDLAG